MSNYLDGIAAESVIEAREFNLVAVLKPRLYIDGNMYCFLYGENVQDGVAGFGESVYLAALDFRKNVYQQIPNVSKG